jgi:hypothetical protein
MATTRHASSLGARSDREGHESGNGQMNSIITWVPCIYCGAANANGREHWIQRGLGTFRNFTPLTDRICEDCNQRLGRDLDEEFLRTGAIGFQRVLHGIQGRDTHRPVNPFLFRGMDPLQPTTLMMPVPHAGHRVLGNAYRDAEGNHCTKPLRQIVVRKPDGRVESVPFNRAWNADQLREAVTGRGLQNGTVIEVYFDDDEGNAEVVAARELVRHVFGSTEEAIAFFGSAAERQVRPVSLAAGITTRYIRALAKNAFHYTLWSCHLVSGNEPAFAPIKRFIMHGEGKSQDFVELNAPQFIPQVADGYVPGDTSHFFSADVTPSGVGAHLQYFIGPRDRPPPARIRLGGRATAIEATWFSCHQARYFSSKTAGFDGELIEIPVVERRIILP